MDAFSRRFHATLPNVTSRLRGPFVGSGATRQPHRAIYPHRTCARQSAELVPREGMLHETAMPSPALLQAVARLDDAVSRAEATLESLGSMTRESPRPGDAAIREAIAELDNLIAAVREKKDG